MCISPVNVAAITDHTINIHSICFSIGGLISILS